MRSTSPAGILKFMALAAFLSATVSATIGVASLTLGGYDDRSELDEPSGSRGGSATRPAPWS